ncbi:flavin monoamine oxidase family protein [Vibrio pectenicida]|uniref:Flavin monoamine oxidase family protein n=1 Tax=Vibrio pectenicida TaxID=62763 RepID=A0A7Y3ZVL8_9VIBR|nr:flavin monoamine oxidase family protein [Vibrio pectenicida]NOH69733.1 flavin monoamine oxidase family protein [Vibrio pectenicida]
MIVSLCKKLIFVSVCGLFFPQSISAEEKKAIVVGAGLSGLTAAYELESKGYQVTVLEAKGHVGGRMNTISMGDQHAESGGELLDDKSVHTELFRYAKMFDVKIVDVGYSDELEKGAYYLDKKLTHYSDFKKEYSPEVKNDLERFNAAFDNLAENVPDSSNPTLAPNAIRLDKITAQEWIDSLELLPFAKTLAEHAIRGEYDEPRNVSLLWLSHQAKVYEDVDDDKVEIKRFLAGTREFANAFVEHINGPVLLNHPVTKVSQNKAGVTVIATDKEFIADVVVVTVPLPVLNKIEFEPELASDKRAAAQEINYGSHVKVLMKYSKRFWLEQGLGGDVISELPIGWLWEGSERQKGEGGVLVAFTSGDFAHQQKGWSDKAIIDNRLEQMEAMYPGSNKYFEYGSVHAWHQDPYIMGGFAAYGPEQMTRHWNTFLTPDGKVYFAGEHTAIEYVGYLEGAVRSGIRVANQIANQSFKVN